MYFSRTSVYVFFFLISIDFILIPIIKLILNILSRRVSYDTSRGIIVMNNKNNENYLGKKRFRHALD